MNAAVILVDAAERAPEAVAVRHEDTTLTYAEVRAAADRVAAAVAALGLGAGDRVLLVGGTVPAWVSAYHGLLSAGAVVVAVNPMSAQAEIEYYLRDSGAALALALGDAADRVRAAADAVVCPYRPLEDLGRDVADEPARRPRERDGDDVAVLLYTSGTTGRPKGAMLTHGNLIAAAEAFLGEFQLRDEDRVLVCLPLSHVFGQGCILNPALMAGATVRLQTRFVAAEALELIARDRISVFAGVPTMYNSLLQAPASAGRGIGDALRLAVSGGAPIPLEILRRFEARFGCPILEGYGMTESTGAATFNRLSRPRKPGRVGTALTGLAIRVVDEQGGEAAPGAVGEVLISGPTVMKGYWERPEASAEALAGGWLRTGDLGSTDEDGDLAIVDRKKDLIIRGGYNVYPREVEEVLAEHPDVVEVLVVGVADEHFGEEVGAAIVARAGSDLDSAAIRAWTEPRLSPYKRPRVIQFLDALPRTSTGKLARRGLDLNSQNPKGRRMADQLTATEPVLYELRGAVAVLTLNRPERLNAWSNDLEDRYFELLDRIEDDPEVRAVVVTGAGRGFCAGADMDDLDLVGTTDLQSVLARPRPRSFPLTVRKPMIAALNGAAAGLGLVEALYCDIRFATPNAKLTTAFALRGLIAEYGISWILPRLVGQANALDLLLSGRVVQGEEALAMGLVNRLVAPETLLDEAVAYAQSLADASSPASMATIKQQVQRHMDAKLADAISESDVLMHESFAWPDVREGVSSYLERRSPAFPPLAARS